MAQKYILGRQAQFRVNIWRYCLTAGGLLLLLALIQITFLSRWKPFGAVPDLMIMAVFAISFFCGRYMGAICGIAAGVLIEALGSVGISILPVIYFLCGYVAGHYAKVFAAQGIGAYMGYSAAIVAVRAGTTVLYAAMTYSDINLPSILIHAVLPEAAGTFLFGVILYYPIRAVCRRLEKKSKP